MSQSGTQNAEYLERMSTSAVAGVDDPEWYRSQHSAYFVASLFFLQGQRCGAAEIMLDDRMIGNEIGVAGHVCLLGDRDQMSIFSTISMALRTRRKTPQSCRYSDEIGFSLSCQ